MKQTIALLILIFLVSCNQSVDSPAIDSTRLPGVWEIRYSAGGDPGYIETNYDPGNHIWLTFSNDSCWRVYDTSVITMGSYRTDASRSRC